MRASGRYILNVHKMLKKKYFLKTTDISIKNKKKYKTFNLGFWCFELNDKNLNLQETLKHPYLNNKYREKSRCYVKNLYEKLSPKLYQNINSLHNTSHPYSYWDNILGYYLESILAQLFEKWTCLEKTKKLEKNFITDVYNFDYKDLVFDTADDYQKQFFGGHYMRYWHHFCYTLIIKNQKKIEYEIIRKPNIKKIKKKQNDINFKIKLIHLISELFLKLNKNVDNIFFSTINPRLTIKTFYKLKNFFLYKKELEIKDFKYDANLRNWCIDFDYQNKFEKFIVKELPKIIPKSVVEGYKFYLNEINTNHNLNIKNVYLTASGLNDVSKILISELKKKKTKVINFQHGGNYGFIKSYTSEEHEIKNSNIFLSFGWNKKYILSALNKTKCKIKNFVPLDFPKINRIKNQSNKILFILPHFEPYFFANNNESYPICDEKLILIDQITQLFNSIDANVLKEVELRFHPHDKKSVKKYFMSKIKSKVKILDAKDKNFPLSFNEYFLCVSLYPGTSFLQTLFMNIPTLVFFDTKLWKMRNQSKKHLKILKKNQIYFDDIKKLSQFINCNSKNLEKWWDTKTIKTVVKNFTNIYANNQNIEKKYTNLVKNIL